MRPENIGGIDKGSIRKGEEPSQEPSKPFLYYRPPGTRVGDPGEAAQPTLNVQQPVPAEPISRLVFQWADTLLSRNLSAHMGLYAPVLSRFGSLSNVSRDTVRIEKQRLLADLAGLRRFEVHDLRIQRQSITPAASARFRIDWHAGGAGGSSQSAQYRLSLRQVDGRWQIDGEEKISQ